MMGWSRSSGEAVPLEEAVASSSKVTSEVLVLANALAR